MNPRRPAAAKSRAPTSFPPPPGMSVSPRVLFESEGIVSIGTRARRGADKVTTLIASPMLFQSGWSRPSFCTRASYRWRRGFRSFCSTLSLSSERSFDMGADIFRAIGVMETCLLTRTASASDFSGNSESRSPKSQ